MAQHFPFSNPLNKTLNTTRRHLNIRDLAVDKKYLTRDKIIGKQVIDAKAMIIGTVRDLAFDLVAKDFSLLVTTQDKDEIKVESDNVVVIGDVILLKTTTAPPEAPETPEAPPTPSPPPKPSKPTAPGLCPECGYQNEASNKFCIKCGSKL
ncbi:hypothetical protein AC480_04190 [miscellaneous Crenarchaeota group archaeon SMTZ1-55]|nr:MAG: hypothetical protein AC480_04190 [miscellaneous Crenarchaeota group archaeon SMTZ1-55]